MSLESSVREALADVDAPAAQLALTYAKAIDDMPPLLGDYGPKLLATLTELLMTPRALAAARKAVNDGPTASPLDELRARRTARQRDPATVDPTAS